MRKEKSISDMLEESKRKQANDSTYSGVFFSEYSYSHIYEQPKEKQEKPKRKQANDPAYTQTFFGKVKKGLKTSTDPEHVTTLLADGLIAGAATGTAAYVFNSAFEKTKEVVTEKAKDECCGCQDICLIM